MEETSITNEENLDVVGFWTVIKLKILEDYSKAYASILNKQALIKHFAYIDGFAGAGKHKSKSTGDVIEGSPAIALGMTPSYSHYHFIDLDGTRVDQLNKLAGNRRNVTVYKGDCNEILLNDVFPKCRYGDYRRALCLLDPYELNPKWNVVEKAGKMKSIEIFLNFMIMDANMNVFRKNPEKVLASQVERMNAFWGDSSWREIAYRKEPGLFGDMEAKVTNDEIAAAYKKTSRRCRL